MSRFSDFRVQAPVQTVPSVLPPVEWAKFGHGVPSPLAFSYDGPTALTLPEAEYVIFTWTDAEWSAMDHVFLNGAQSTENQSSKLIHQWHLFGGNAPAGGPGGALWGYFQLISIPGRAGDTHRVLLFKADAHLAHPPWLKGLTELVDLVITASKAKYVLSIGTAGGANGSQNLGDAVVTNGARLQLELQANKQAGAAYDNKTMTCANWYPSLSLMPDVQAALLMPLAKVATTQSLQAALDRAKAGTRQGAKELAPFALTDLMNSAIDPTNLTKPAVIDCKGKPLLSTDYYYIADADTQYAALEMDDAVIAHTAQGKGVSYAFVRNISDTLVPAKTPAGVPIPPSAREAWSSQIYDSFGLYTSFNGALAAWAVVAGA